MYFLGELSFNHLPTRNWALLSLFSKTTLLTINTSDTSLLLPRSTLHQGSVCSWVCVQLACSHRPSKLPSTALLAAPLQHSDEWTAFRWRAMFSDKAKGRKVSAEYRMLIWQVPETINSKVCPTTTTTTTTITNMTNNQNTRGGSGWGEWWEYIGHLKELAWRKYFMMKSSNIVEFNDQWKREKDCK